MYSYQTVYLSAVPVPLWICVSIRDENEYGTEETSRVQVALL